MLVQKNLVILWLGYCCYCNIKLIWNMGQEGVS